MKTRVNLTIEDSVLQATKRYAEKRGTSVSEIVEEYLKGITRSHNKINVIDLIESLPPSKINTEIDWKEEYYKENAKKYGF
jgi:hypothetical protein